MSPPYRYRAIVLELLRPHGFRPDERHDPALVRGLLSALYKFEIRELKLKLDEMQRLMGAQDLDAYRRRVLALKGRYAALRWEAADWLESSVAGPSPPCSPLPADGERGENPSSEGLRPSGTRLGFASPCESEGHRGEPTG